jgi:5-formyltetrahydrofolate cyclo-ligase
VDKMSVRKLCISRLKTTTFKNNYILDKNISAKVDHIIKKLKPKSILFYLPLKLEVDLRPLLKKYRRKLKILIPKVQKESFVMVEYRLPLEENKFKILERKHSSNAYKNVDLIIVPIIAMDRNMQRVGFGKGMYDRFYYTLKKKPIVVFVQRVACVSNVAICDKYDIYGDYYITSKEKIIGKTNDRYITGRNRRYSRCRSRIFRK